MGRGGCDKTAIVPAIMVIAMFYMISAALLVFLAVTLASNNEASMVYGSEDVGVVPGNISASIQMIFMALIMCPLACLGAYSARSHNKFLLVVYCGASVFLMLTLNATGGGLLALSNLPMSDATQTKCLKFAREDDVSDQVCGEFFASKNVEYLRALWVNLHDRGMNRSNPEYKEITTFMVKMQKGEVTGGSCCGFGRPAHCSGNSTETCDLAVQSVTTETNYEETSICTQGAGGCVSIYLYMDEMCVGIFFLTFYFNFFFN
jgi:hypothetical protein